MFLTNTPKPDTQSPESALDPAAPWMRKWSARLFVLIAVLVCLGILGRAGVALKPYLEAPTRVLHVDREHRDIDWGLLNGGLDQIHDFRDTGRWWTNTWCGGVPFWRPLTSYAFWGMRLLWPAEYMLPRQIILIALHLCFVGLTAVMLWKLTRRPWLVLLTLQLFAGFRPDHMGDPQAYIQPVNDLLLDPKNIPDPLVGLATLGSLLLLMNGRWLAALALAAIGVGFKENGFMIWPLAILILAWIHRERVFVRGGPSFVMNAIKRHSLPVVAWISMLLVLGLVHYISVGVGFREGSNSFWLWRVAAFVGCPALSDIIMFDRSAGVMSVLLFGAVIVSWRRGPIAKVLILMSAMTLAILFDSWRQQTTWDVSAFRVLLQGQGVGRALFGMLWFAILLTAWDERAFIIFAVSLALVAAAPSWMAAQTWAHVRYTASVFMEMATAAVLIQCAKTAIGAIDRWRNADDSPSAG